MILVEEYSGQREEWVQETVVDAAKWDGAVFIVLQWNNCIRGVG